MSFGLGTSESRTSARTATQSGPVTSSGGNASAQQSFGRRNVNASDGALVLGDKASFGSIHAAKGSTVTITDGGAFQQAQDAIERIVRAQSDTVSASLASLGNIAETRGTDGANLSAGFATTATKGIFASAIVAAVLLVVVLFLKRH